MTDATIRSRMVYLIFNSDSRTFEADCLGSKKRVQKGLITAAGVLK